MQRRQLIHDGWKNWMIEYKLRLFMVWHESTNPATSTTMEQRGRRRVHKTKGEAEGPMKWQDQRSKKIT